jgi:hypothetical protein
MVIAVLVTSAPRVSRVSFWQEGQVPSVLGHTVEWQWGHWIIMAKPSVADTLCESA